MGRKKPEWLDENLPKLVNLCEQNGYEYEKKSIYQYRIYGATHVIDIYPSRMVYHRLECETIRSVEPYPRVLDERFNKEQVEQLLATGDFK